MKRVNAFTVFPELMSPEVFYMLQKQDLTLKKKKKKIQILTQWGIFSLLYYRKQECVLGRQNMAFHWSLSTRISSHSHR